jgi:tetraacyldisaccharide 4'-kinase
VPARQGDPSARPAGPVPAWLGAIAEPFYRAAIARRNRRFDAGIGVTRLNVPVVSVGNLSVGGTGKTPMVMHVLRSLLEHGRKPAIAMRGYTKRSRHNQRAGGGTAGRPELLIDQTRLARRPQSDEADEYQRMFPDGSVPLVAQPDRLAGLRDLLERPFQREVDCVVLDDGFQHRRIARDFDIVLIDASRPPVRDHLLPRGYLREPPESLRRASCVIITHTELCAGPDAADSCDSFVELTSFITRHHGRPPIAMTSHVWTALKRARSHAPDDDDVLPLDHLLSRRIVAACAIGNPRGFLTTLDRTLRTDRSRPGELLASHVLPDHDPFDEREADAIARSAAEHAADAIVVTEKDWSKLRRYPSSFWPCPILRPELSLVFNTGAERFESALLQAVARPAPSASSSPPGA